MVPDHELMKFFNRAILFLALFCFAGCAMRTEFGECIGLNGEEDPKLVYKYSALNIGLAIFTFGLIVPPVIVVLDGLKCPVAKKSL